MSTLELELVAAPRPGMRNPLRTEPRRPLWTVALLSEPCALVAEDDPDCLLGLKLMLKDAGYHVIVAADGHAAFKSYLRAERVDLLIVDLMLPVMDGLALIHDVKLIDPGLPVLATTGAADARRKLNAARHLGAVGLLPKPFGRAEFLAAVKAASESGPPRA